MASKSKKALKRIKSVRDLVQPKMWSDGRSGFVLSDGSLVDLEGGYHEDLVGDYPVEFGLSKDEADVSSAVRKGAIRFRDGGSNIELDSNRYSPRQVADLILEEKIPASTDREVTLDSGHFVGSTDIEELLEAKSWKHLQSLKNRRSR